jgi:RHS repeat-associated protein
MNAVGRLPPPSKNEKLMRYFTNKKGDIVYAYDQDGNLLGETGLRREAAYRYNGQNRMVYSEVASRAERSRIAADYAYDAFGRRTVTQDEGGQAMRTLYDGTGFETIRKGVTFRDGRFTTRYSGGIQSGADTGTEGNRYRWVGDVTEGGTRSAEAEGYTATAGRYTGVSVTLYGRGEAVAVSRSGNSGTRGGPAYLGKDILGSVRSTTGEYGSLEDRYEYDAFGKPYQGDLTTGMNLGYTGKPYDPATGMYNYGYRDYKPELARFTTVDPIRDGANWFAYVNNDPVNWIDPWGLQPNDKKDNAFTGIWNTIKDVFDSISVGGKISGGGVEVYVNIGEYGFTGTTTYEGINYNGLSDVHVGLGENFGFTYGRMQMNVDTSFNVGGDLKAGNIAVSAPTVREINSTVNTKLGTFSTSYNYETNKLSIGFSTSFPK